MKFTRIPPAMPASPMFDRPETIWIGLDGKALSPEQLRALRVVTNVYVPRNYTFGFSHG